MEIFVFIITNNIAPIFFIITLGFILGKKFNLDIKTLSKINFYIFVPAFIFVSLYETIIDLDLLKVVIFGILFLVVLYILAATIGKLTKQSPSLNGAFINSAIFYNSGNFGVPLIALVFKNSEFVNYALSIQIMILMLQNITVYTVGIYNANKSEVDLKGIIRKIFSMPSLYCIMLALTLKSFNFDLSELFLWPALVYLKNGLISIALLTLGVQISVTKLQMANFNVFLAVIFRLCVAPLVAYILILLMGFNDIISKVLLISASVPSAVNTALLAVEFNNEPDFATQVVLTTTIICSVTLSVVIYLSNMLF